MSDFERNRESTEAAHSVLLELFHILEPYPNVAILVGGMVPGLKFRGAKDPHQGTLDVDLVLVGQAAALQLNSLLQKNGYRKSPWEDFQYLRKVTQNGRVFDVKLDLLTAAVKPEGTHLVDLMGAQAFPLKAGALVPRQVEQVQLSGSLPDGEAATATVTMAGIVPFLALKAFAIAGRKPPEDKDPYDVYYCLRHYPGGLEALRESFRPFAGMALLQEAAGYLRTAFATAEAPASAAVRRSARLFPDATPDQVAQDAAQRALALANIMATGYS